jgi:hypothetical protein
VEDEHGRGTPGGGQQRPGQIEFEPFVAGLGQLQFGDGDDRDPYRDVDQEGQPPGHHRERATEHQAEHRADALHGGRHRHRAVPGVAGGVRRRDERQAGGRGHRGPGPLHRAGHDQGGRVGGHAADQGCDGEHPDAADERPFLADGIPEPAAEQQQTAEGEHVGGDHPALGGIGQVEVGLHPRQCDHDDGAVQRRHQLHAGDRDDRDPQHAGRQRPADRLIAPRRGHEV